MFHQMFFLFEFPLAFGKAVITAAEKPVSRMTKKQMKQMFQEHDHQLDPPVVFLWCLFPTDEGVIFQLLWNPCPLSKSH